MSCFAMGATSSSRMSSRGKNRSWPWWRKCAGLAAAAHSRIRRSVIRVRWSAGPGNLGGGRRGRRAPPLPSVQRGHHHRSFAPVYVDELYSQQLHKPKGLSVVHEEEPSTSASKLARVTAAAGNTTTTTRAGGSKARVAAAAAAVGGNKARAAAAAARSVLLSPMRGGGGGVGMGEVDMRAELFIRKFREEMRLQSQKSAEELQAMLARGL